MAHRKLNIYEKLFFYVYTSTSRTNKSIPDWSTTIFISVATTLYMFAIGILSPLDMKSLGRKGFMFSMLFVIAIHWFYFLRNGRIFEKFKKLKPKASLTGKILSGLYTFGGFAALFYTLGMDWTYTLIIAIVFGAVEFSTYIFGTEPIKFQ
nr:hypothetical protein [uncultured Allomuricauda sp.]